MGAVLGINIAVVILALVALIGIVMVFWKSRQVNAHHANQRHSSRSSHSSQHGGNSSMFSALTVGVFLLILVYLLCNKTQELIQM
jgi:ABC-type sulfate transport system permease component